MSNFERYISEIRGTVKPELLPILDELAKIDPHDLVPPDAYFTSKSSARGFIWSLFLKKSLQKG